MKEEKYLQVLTEQIRCKMAREAVEEEIRCHIEDQKAAFMSEGMEAEEAEKAAVREMGDPVRTGNELDKIHCPKMPWLMIGLILVLSAAGYLVRAGIRARIGGDGSQTLSAARDLPALVLCIGLMAGICYADYTRIAQRARELMLIILAALGLGKLFFGAMVNGSAQWISLGGVSINVPLILFLTVPLYAAVLYRYRGQGYEAVIKGFLWMAPGVWIVWRTPNITMASTLFLAYLIVLAAAVYKRWFKVAVAKVLAALGTVVVLLPLAGCALLWFTGAEYQKERLVAVFTADKGNWVTSVIKETLKNSSLVGQSASESAEMMEGTVLTEYTLAGTAAYYGIAAAVLLAGLMLFLFIRFARVSIRQRNQLGMLMGIGCSAVFLIQAALYLANNAGLIYVSCYCPFFTGGGSGMVMSYVLMGIMLSIFRYQDTAPERKHFRRLFRMAE